MNNNSSKYFYFAGIISVLAALMLNSAFAQQDTIAPPTMGQETKGTPAQIEDQGRKQEPVEVEAVDAAAEDTTKNKSVFSALGTTKITESKRENGQIYRIELEHSMGSKQYIEETDSDGKIQSTSNDIEETPNLPKWKIGSW